MASDQKNQTAIPLHKQMAMGKGYPGTKQPAPAKQPEPKSKGKSK